MRKSVSLGSEKLLMRWVLLFVENEKNKSLLLIGEKNKHKFESSLTDVMVGLRHPASDMQPDNSQLQDGNLKCHQ